jgi:hypothetical protein
MESNMKKAVRLFPAVLLILAAGCREYETSTVIHPDGSCDRSTAVTRESDDSTRAAADLAVLAPGPGWTMKDTVISQTAKEIQGQKRYIYRATRTFKRVRDLDRLLNADTTGGGPRLIVSVRMDRKFRWFNTFYDYRETYSIRSFFADVPVTDFMTRKELDLYYQKEDTLDLKGKADAWFTEGYGRFVVGRLVRMAEGHPLPGLGPERVRAESDSVKSLLFRNMKTLEEDSTALIQLLDSRFRNPRFGEWRIPLDSLQADIQRTWETLMEIGSDSYVCSVAMPGLIMDTNAPTVEGNKAEWKFEGERCQMEPYEMRVESRVVNRWAVWVTGLLVLAAVAVFILGAARKK